MAATSRWPKAGDHSSIVSGSTSFGFFVGWRSRLERYGGKSCRLMLSLSPASSRRAAAAW